LAATNGDRETAGSTPAHGPAQSRPRALWPCL